MILREAVKLDYDKIMALHEDDGFSYSLPDMNSPSWVRRFVIEEQGEIVGAGLGHLSSETFLILKDATRMRMARRFMALQDAAVQAARDGGLGSLHAWVSPSIDEKFGRQLLGVGWSKPLWPAYEMVIR